MHISLDNTKKQKENKNKNNKDNKIIKIKRRINEIENRKTIKEINKTKGWFFEKIDRLTNLLLD